MTLRNPNGHLGGSGGANSGAQQQAAAVSAAGSKAPLGGTKSTKSATDNSVTPQRHDLTFSITGSNSSEWMLICLFISNFLQLFASQVGYNWLTLNITDESNFSLCVLQSLGFAIADLSSGKIERKKGGHRVWREYTLYSPTPYFLFKAIWATALCYGTVIKVFGGNTLWMNYTSTKIIASVIGFGIPIFLTLIPYAYPEYTVADHPVFGATGTANSWCFYSKYDVNYRVWNHYLWIIICIGLNLLGYAFMITNIWYMQSQGGAGQEARNAKLQNTIKKLIAYPVAFTALYLPICINRIMALSL